MAKVVDITDKLSFDGNPCLMIKGKKLEVNADAPTMLKVLGYVKKKDVDVSDVYEAYQLIFPEESRQAIDEMKLNTSDWMIVVETAIDLIMGDDQPGEQ